MRQQEVRVAGVQRWANSSACGLCCTARQSFIQLIIAFFSIFGVHYQPLRPWLLSCALTLDSAFKKRVQKTQTMLRSAGRQCQLFVIFQMLSWKVFFFVFFFQLWKLSQVAILKVEHCVFFCIWKLIYSETKPCYFWFFISKILCFIRRLFENQIFRKFWFFNFFSKNNLDDHFKKTRNCRGTHWLPNKTNRNVLASKLRPVKTFQKR